MTYKEIAQSRSLIRYCEAQGIILKRSGTFWTAKCPIHNEQNGRAFVVFDDQKWRCFGKCAKGGDILDLDLALHGGALSDAAARVSNGVVCPPVLKRREPEISKPYELTKEDLILMDRAAGRLEATPELATIVREKGPWVLGIEQVAIEQNMGFCPSLSFGDIKGSALLFRYPHGIKARWKDKTIRWIRGGPHASCWRQNFLDGQKRVFLTEGEIDTLTLIGGGLCFVMSIASASTLPRPEIFAGREVVIVPDIDEAGRKCAQALYETISKSAKVVRTIKI